KLSLSEVLIGADPPERSRRAIAIGGCVATLGATSQPLPGLTVLRPALAPLPCRLSTPQLVELLKYPTCIGKARRVILDQLENRYRRKFADQWEFVAWAEKHAPGLDLISPPKRFTIVEPEKKNNGR